MLDSDNLNSSASGVGGGNNVLNPNWGNSVPGNDDYDVFTYDENDDFFQEGANSTPGITLDSLPQRGNQTSTALDIPMTISNSAIRLVQQSITRIKNSASSTGLFTVTEEKPNSMETKGSFLFLFFSFILISLLTLFSRLLFLITIGLLSEAPRSNRRNNPNSIPQSASQIAIAAAHAEIQSKLSLSTSPSNINSNNNSNNTGQSSISVDTLQHDQSIDQLENQMNDNISDQQMNTLMMSPSINTTIGSPRRSSSFRKQPLPQIQRIMSSSLQAITPSSNLNYSQTTTDGIVLSGPPSLSRGVSARATVEASRQALMEMISQIRSSSFFSSLILSF